MNRAIGRRTLVETRRDARALLAQIVRAARAGWFEIHAYSILSTHFHLLVRSPSGEMWRGMRRFENGYVRWFNRTRRRDGPLFRGRFLSRRVRSDTHRRAVERYIDGNAVKAGLVVSPSDYPFSSAYFHAGARIPSWLSWEGAGDGSKCGETGAGNDSMDGGLSNGKSTATAAEDWLVVQRLTRGGADAPDPLDDLIAASPLRLRRWLAARALVADGTAGGVAVVRPSTVQSVIASESKKEKDWTVSLSGTRRAAWPILTAGMLRDTCGATFAEIAARLDASCGAVRSRAQAHMALLRVDAAYARRAGTLLALALRSDWGPSIAREPPRRRRASHANRLLMRS